MKIILNNPGSLALYCQNEEEAYLIRATFSIICEKRRHRPIWSVFQKAFECSEKELCLFLPNAFSDFVYDLLKILRDNKKALDVEEIMEKYRGILIKKQKVF